MSSELMLVESLARMPHELQMKILSRVSGEALRSLAEASPVIGYLLTTSSFRHQWLRQRGGVDFGRLEEGDYHMIGRLVQMAWDLSPEWAVALYGGLTLYAKINLFEDLLADRDRWRIARHFAHIEQQADAQEGRNAYGIFSRHLQWRFIHAGCVEEEMRERGQ